MAYTITNVYALDPSYAGASLRCQLVQYSAGAQVNSGSPISTGFFEQSGGQGLFDHALSVADDFVGWAHIYDNAAPSVILASVPINPRELEYTDARSSSILSAVNGLISTIGVAGAGLTALPGMVWGNSVRTLSSFGTLVADIVAAVWSAAVRTLTIAIIQLPTSVQGSDVTILRAVTFGATFGNLNISASWSKIYFTVKASNQHADDQAVVQLVKSNPSAGGDGLIRLNRAAATANQGALTIDQPGGAVTIALTDDATAQLNHGDYFYDIKALSSDGSSVVLAQGNCLVRLTSTHTV